MLINMNACRHEEGSAKRGDYAWKSQRVVPPSVDQTVCAMGS